MKVAIAVPCIELVLAIVATIVPTPQRRFPEKVPMLVIFLVLLVIGEVVRVWSARGRKEEYKGLPLSSPPSASLPRPRPTPSSVASTRRILRRPAVRDRKRASGFPLLPSLRTMGYGHLASCEVEDSWPSGGYGTTQPALSLR